jgi:hypothetical protein
VIVRDYAACKTCRAPHLLRIGMGMENSQRHKFPCRKCGEEIEVGLDIDRVKIGWRVCFGVNAEPILPDESASVVNLHADFLVPAGSADDRHVFPSLEFGPKILSALIKAREAGGLWSRNS